MSMTAAAYIRVSSERQDEYSPDSQIKLIRDYAKKNDIDVPEEFIFFDDGISAKSAQKRTQFNNMIALAKEKDPPFQAILVWKFSRFARNQEESIVYKNILRKKGIQVISISEPIIDSPFGDLIERIIEWMDEYYLINLSTEVKRGMTEKLTRGEAMCPPAYGYDIKDGKYIINPEEAPNVVEIFEDYVNGMPLRQIALKCSGKGMRTHRGNLFELRTIQYILKNPVYVGKIRWSTDGRTSSKRDYENPNTVIVDGVHEPIISTELWDKAQLKLDATKKMYGKYQRSEQPADWMLKGLMRCDCGATLTRLSTATPSMQCYEYTHGKGKCVVSHCLSINKANKLVIDYLKNIIKDKNYHFIPMKETRQQIDYDALIEKEEMKLKRAKDAYLAGADTVAEYKENKARITKAINSLIKQREKENENTAVNVEEFTQRVKKVILTIENPDESEQSKNEALRTIIEKITFQKPENSLAVVFHA